MKSAKVSYEISFCALTFRGVTIYFISFSHIYEYKRRALISEIAKGVNNYLLIVDTIVAKKEIRKIKANWNDEASYSFLIQNVMQMIIWTIEAFD